MAKSRSPVDQIEFMRNLLAFLLVGAFIGAMGAFTLFVIPEGNKDILTYMVGQLSGMAITVLSFYFVNKVGQDALDAKRSDNTKTALETIKEVAKGTSVEPPPADIELAPGESKMITAEEEKL